MGFVLCKNDHNRDSESRGSKTVSETKQIVNRKIGMPKVATKFSQESNSKTEDTLKDEPSCHRQGNHTNDKDELQVQGGGWSLDLQATSA